MLFRLNKRAVNVAVLGESQFHGNPAVSSIPDRGRNRGLGHGNDDVGFDFVFFCELHTAVLAHLVHRFTEEMTVGTRKIYELENIEFLIPLCELLTTQTVRIHYRHLARLYVAKEFRTYRRKCACFRREDESPLAHRGTDRFYNHARVGKILRGDTVCRDILLERGGAREIAVVHERDSAVVGAGAERD